MPDFAIDPLASASTNALPLGSGHGGHSAAGGDRLALARVTSSGAVSGHSHRFPLHRDGTPEAGPDTPLAISPAVELNHHRNIPNAGDEVAGETPGLFMSSDSLTSFTSVNTLSHHNPYPNGRRGGVPGVGSDRGNAATPPVDAAAVAHVPSSSSLNIPSHSYPSFPVALVVENQRNSEIAHDMFILAPLLSDHETALSKPSNQGVSDASDRPLCAHCSYFYSLSLSVFGPKSSTDGAPCITVHSYSELLAHLNAPQLGVRTRLNFDALHTTLRSFTHPHAAYNDRARAQSALSSTHITHPGPSASPLTPHTLSPMSSGASSFSALPAYSAITATASAAATPAAPLLSPPSLGTSPMPSYPYSAASTATVAAATAIIPQPLRVLPALQGYAVDSTRWMPVIINAGQDRAHTTTLLRLLSASAPDTNTVFAAANAVSADKNSVSETSATAHDALNAVTANACGLCSFVGLVANAYGRAALKLSASSSPKSAVELHNDQDTVLALAVSSLAALDHRTLFYAPSESTITSSLADSTFGANAARARKYELRLPIALEGTNFIDATTRALYHDVANRKQLLLTVTPVTVRGKLPRTPPGATAAQSHVSLLQHHQQQQQALGLTVVAYSNARIMPGTRCSDRGQLLRRVPLSDPARSSVRLDHLHLMLNELDSYTSGVADAVGGRLHPSKRASKQFPRYASSQLDSATVALPTLGLNSSPDGQRASALATSNRVSELLVQHLPRLLSISHADVAPMLAFTESASDMNDDNSAVRALSVDLPPQALIAADAKLGTAALGLSNMLRVFTTKPPAVPAGISTEACTPIISLRQMTLDDATSPALGSGYTSRNTGAGRRGAATLSNLEQSEACAAHAASLPVLLPPFVSYRHSDTCSAVVTLAAVKAGQLLETSLLRAATSRRAAATQSHVRVVHTTAAATHSVKSNPTKTLSRGGALFPSLPSAAAAELRSAVTSDALGDLLFQWRRMAKTHTALYRNDIDRVLTAREAMAAAGDSSQSRAQNSNAGGGLGALVGLGGGGSGRAGASSYYGYDAAGNAHGSTSDYRLQQQQQQQQQVAAATARGAASGNGVLRSVFNTVTSTLQPVADRIPAQLKHTHLYRQVASVVAGAGGSGAGSGLGHAGQSAADDAGDTEVLVTGVYSQLSDEHIHQLRQQNLFQPFADAVAAATAAAAAAETGTVNDSQMQSPIAEVNVNSPDDWQNALETALHPDLSESQQHLQQYHQHQHQPHHQSLAIDTAGESGADSNVGIMIEETYDEAGDVNCVVPLPMPTGANIDNSSLYNPNADAYNDGTVDGHYVATDVSSSDWHGHNQ